MSRIPIRLRLTLAFALAMALVLGGTGFVIYGHLGRSLDRTLNQGLRARAADVTALVKQADTGLRQSPRQAFSSSSTGFAQVLDARGRVYDETSGLGKSPLLSPDQLARARQVSMFIGRARRGGATIRLLATPVSAQDQHLVVVVGSPLASRDEALAQLRSELLIGGPVALLLASLAGYLMAAAALRPVERMRSRAAAISARRVSERLPVAPAGDELSRLGETLNEMLARLEAALERERSFVANASHELRTPLALLRVEIELALESPRSKEELESALRSAGDETDRLGQLAEDLLLLARLDNGVLPLRMETVELDDVLSGIVARFERRAHDAGRAIESGGGISVSADRLRLGQALANLVENALRYGSGSVRLFAVERDSRVEVHVTDEGAGFAAAFLPRAFERFSRADESRGGGGAGLGLAIVRSIAEAHRGAAEAANRRDGGADVWLSIPSDLPSGRASPGRNRSGGVQTEATRMRT